jgi:hypothetical protein
MTEFLPVFENFGFPIALVIVLGTILYKVLKEWHKMQQQVIAKQDKNISDIKEFYSHKIKDMQVQMTMQADDIKDLQAKYELSLKDDRSLLMKLTQENNLYLKKNGTLLEKLSKTVKITK